MDTRVWKCVYTVCTQHGWLKVWFENRDRQTPANLAIQDRCFISLTVYIFKLHTSQKGGFTSAIRSYAAGRTRLSTETIKTRNWRYEYVCILVSVLVSTLNLGDDAKGRGSILGWPCVYTLYWLLYCCSQCRFSIQVLSMQAPLNDECRSWILVYNHVYNVVYKLQFIFMYY